MHLHLLNIMQERIGWMLRADSLTCVRQVAMGHWERRVMPQTVCPFLTSSYTCRAHRGPTCLRVMGQRASW